jgi:hypothetical protein
VALLVQIGMSIYFTITMKVAPLSLKIITIACYTLINLLTLAFPFKDPGTIPIFKIEDSPQIPLKKD